MAQFDAKLVERCLVCAPGGLPSITGELLLEVGLTAMGMQITT